MQGDAEAAHGLSVSPFMSRVGADMAKSQIGFLSFVVKPLFSAWCEFDGDNALLDRLANASRYWEQLQAKA